MLITRPVKPPATSVDRYRLSSEAGGGAGHQRRARRLRGDFNGLRITTNEGVKLVAPLAGVGLFTALGGPAGHPAGPAASGARTGAGTGDAAPARAES